MLNKVSRSFALVIQQLPFELRDPSAFFTWCWRLDTVEDDMKLEMKVKGPLLQTFHEVIEKDGWTMKDCGDTSITAFSWSNHDKVIAQYKALKPASGGDQGHNEENGQMFDFAEKMGVDSLKEWDLYCHYVAGLVGHGLTNLFVVESRGQVFGQRTDVSNIMGLFCKKRI